MQNKAAQKMRYTKTHWVHEFFSARSSWCVVLALPTLVVVAAWVAPALWLAGRYLAQHDIVPQLAPFGLGTYFRRALLVLALSGVVVMRYLAVPKMMHHPMASGLFGGTLRASPLSVGTFDLRRGTRAFALGFLSLLGVGCIAIFLGQLVVLHDGTALCSLSYFCQSIAVACVVAVIEEILFRGVLLSILGQSFAPIRAVWVQAMLFAAAHGVGLADARFAVSIAPPADLAAYLRAVLSLLLGIGAPIANGLSPLGPLTTLVVAGIVLGRATQQTGGLSWPVGLHAGWILALRLIQADTKVPGAPSIWLRDGFKGGFLPLGVVVLCGLFTKMCASKRAAPCVYAAANKPASSCETRSHRMSA